MYEVKEPFWQFVDHWQTLIAGVFALLAAGGTIWITRSAAKRQIKAANEAANREVAAAREQLEDDRAARHEDDERRLDVIKWAITISTGA